MSIELDCPLCYRQWKVRDDQANRRTACPGCDEEFYVPETQGARGGSGRRSDRDDEEDEPTSGGFGGLSKGTLIGIGAGAGGLLLVVGIVLAVVLAKRPPQTNVAQPNSPQTNPPGGFRPGGVPEDREISRNKFHRIAPFHTLAQVEQMFGPGTPIAAPEMREILNTDGCQTFCPPQTADKICDSPVVAFYKWQKDRMAIYATFNSKAPTGVLVCAVYVGPDVPFKKVSELKPNLGTMNTLP